MNKRAMPEGRETRLWALDRMEVRAAGEDGEPRHVFGHAAVFNQWSEELGFFMPFVEKIEPGAFASTIANDDIRALFNHNPEKILGRRRGDERDNLALSEDDTGLYFDVEMPDTSYARDLVVSVDRGDVDQASFGFRVVEEKWREVEDGPDERTLLEVQLFDVSPVPFPAYTGTDVDARSLREQHMDVSIGVRRYEHWLRSQGRNPRDAILKARQRLLQTTL